MPPFKIISIWHSFLRIERNPFNIFCGWKQKPLWVSATVKLTDYRAANLHARGGAAVGPQLPSPPVFNISITSLWAPPLCISPPKEVMDILSLAAWPLVILFHRPAPRWRPTQWRPLSLLPVDTPTDLIEQISILWWGHDQRPFQHPPQINRDRRTACFRLFFFFVLSLPFLATACDFYPGSSSRVRFPTSGPPLLGGDQRLQLLTVSV